MTEESKAHNQDIRLSALEIRISAVEALVNKAIGAAQAESKGLRRKSNVEKDKIKAELLKGVPYDKKALENLKFTELRMLTSAIGISAFGLKRDQMIKSILGAQKKKKG
jgi:hypothetical protein